MKKLILFFVAVFTLLSINTVNATEPSNDVKMSTEELKNLLISELKKSTQWDYADSQYHKINIVEKSISREPGVIYFNWTFQNQHPDHPEWDYVLTRKFKIDFRVNKCFPASEITIPMKWVKR